jgi:hypothetical protein
VRAKVNLWGNDGGSTAAALIPFVKAPSAPIGIGNGAVEEGLIAPFALSFPNDFQQSAWQFHLRRQSQPRGDQKRHSLRRTMV